MPMTPKSAIEIVVLGHDGKQYTAVEALPIGSCDQQGKIRGYSGLEEVFDFTDAATWTDSGTGKVLSAGRRIRVFGPNTVVFYEPETVDWPDLPKLEYPSGYGLDEDEGTD